MDRGDSCCQKCVVKYRVSSPAWSVIFQMYNLGFVYRKICTKTHPCGEKKKHRDHIGFLVSSASEPTIGIF